jgi:hypothetical protein
MSIAPRTLCTAAIVLALLGAYVMDMSKPQP